MDPASAVSAWAADTALVFTAKGVELVPPPEMAQAFCPLCKQESRRRTREVVVEVPAPMPPVGPLLLKRLNRQFLLDQGYSPEHARRKA